MADNTQTFSGGGNPAGGATGTWNNDNTQVNPQAMAALAALLQTAQQNQQPAMSLTNGQVGNAQGQPINQQAQASNGPYQKGVQKALQESGYVHAQQAIQAGMPPDQIQNHGIMTGQQSPQQTLQAILPPTNAMQGSSYNQQTGQLQEGGWANRALKGLAMGGPLGALAGMMGPSAQGQMDALKSAQVLKAGQPAEIALPQAQAQEAGGRGNYFNALANQTNQIIKRGGPPLS